MSKEQGHLWIDRKLHKQLKVQSAIEDRSMNAIVEALIRDYLESKTLWQDAIKGLEENEVH